MFYPFNSAIAARETRKFTDKYAMSQYTLVEAYLMIAHVHVERAAMKGYTRTHTYFPYSIASRMIEILESSGFKVTNWTVDGRRTNSYVLTWDED